MSGHAKADLKVNEVKIKKEWTAPVLKKISIEEITASGAKSTTTDHGGNAMS
jgi:hypothetical protein